MNGINRGYGIFGKEYEIMLRNDLHAEQSIDHVLMKEMILVNEDSCGLLYGSVPVRVDMSDHELYLFALQFQKETIQDTIDCILQYTSNIANDFQEPFESMQFGGTEKEILKRGTDWCADMARVGAVLLMCNGIPARIVHLVNPELAYHGHVVTEAYYNGKYGVCDFVYGYRFVNEKPLDTYELMKDKQKLKLYEANYANLYRKAAISEYNPMEKNDYSITYANSYYLKLMNSNHNGKWIMGEDK